ncbi:MULTISPECIES: hypothetical protein [Haloferacaceae]|jgi:hypothetical protein|uniref:Ig-like domain-containing protein n=1 Tax=Halohasta litchfieldiae TaxID=1073996 RepID=A0A1H6VEW8_9EURY|nr:MULTISPECIES: hypothetical protein [Halorubraceae]SEJ03121.1 hypothetical protein SAMN05444271_11714 [Halohasta litchfieldiae]
MFRRGFIGVVFSSLLSGCIAFSGGGDGFIDIHNRTDSVRDVTVTLVQQESQETVLDETYHVEPNSDQRIDDAFNDGVFEAEVIVDNERSEEFELGVGRCPGTRFFIGVEIDEIILDQSVCD